MSTRTGSGKEAIDRYVNFAVMGLYNIYIYIVYGYYKGILIFLYIVVYLLA